jgi:CheY-like chemotaxis protein
MVMNGGGGGRPKNRDSPTTTRTPRVLVVDDDQLIGRSIERVLGDFDITFAQSPAGALGRVGSGKFDAIVCDFQMPGMNGIEFYEELARVDPALARRAVFLSGWVGDPAYEAFLRRSGCRSLAKPFLPEELRRAVAAACAEVPRG